MVSTTSPTASRTAKHYPVQHATTSPTLRITFVSFSTYCPFRTPNSTHTAWLAFPMRPWDLKAESQWCSHQHPEQVCCRSCSANRWSFGGSWSPASEARIPAYEANGKAIGWTISGCWSLSKMCSTRNAAGTNAANAKRLDCAHAIHVAPDLSAFGRSKDSSDSWSCGPSGGITCARRARTTEMYRTKWGFQKTVCSKHPTNGVPKDTLKPSHDGAQPSECNTGTNGPGDRSTTSNNAEDASASTDLYPGSKLRCGTSSSTPDAFGRTTSTYSESQRHNMCLRRCSRNGADTDYPSGFYSMCFGQAPSKGTAQWAKRSDDSAWASRIVNSCICLAQRCPETAVSFASRIVETKFWDARKPSHINRDHSCGDTVRTERI